MRLFPKDGYIKAVKEHCFCEFGIYSEGFPIIFSERRLDGKFCFIIHISQWDGLFPLCLKSLKSSHPQAEISGPTSSKRAHFLRLYTSYSLYQVYFPYRQVQLGQNYSTLRTTHHVSMLNISCESHFVATRNIDASPPHPLRSKKAISIFKPNPIAFTFFLVLGKFVCLGAKLGCRLFLHLFFIELRLYRERNMFKLDF